jgi:acyl carrier protein
VVRATYEEISAYMGTKEEPFPVHATDRLKEDLEIDDEDLLDVIYAIAKRCGRRLDDLDKNPLYPKMTTVEDLIRVFMAQEKETAAEHAVAT